MQAMKVVSSPDMNKITLTSNVRVFMRRTPSSKLLFRTGSELPRGSVVTVGDSVPMTYDHRDQQAFPLIRMEGHFILEEETRQERP